MSATPSKNALRLIFIGSGQVATHLSIALEAAGHHVLAVYSRQLMHAASLTRQLNQAIPTDSLNLEDLPAVDLYIVSLTDAAVAAVMQEIKLPAGSCVVHTSGSLPMAVLEREDLQLKTGVMYPIQTFSRNLPVNFADTPFALEAPDPALATLLEYLIASLGSKAIFMASPERKLLHLAAVFACNFTNHLLGIGHEILTQHNLPPALLHPLINNTVQKALKNNPFAVQTGPAIRHDENILQAHIQLLAEEPAYQQIYQLLSQSIQNKKEA
jgi:predicted short-subunit dehydrogenase-like oxidoreductase (DUF2520 family)